MFRLQDLFTRGAEKRQVVRPDVTHLIVCVFLIGIHAAVLTSGRLAKIEALVFDAFSSLRSSLKTDSSIAIIEIDRESVDAIGTWPWPVSYQAEMMRTLKKAGAKAALIDFLPAASEPEETQAMAQALADFPAVYLPVELAPKPEKKIWIHDRPIVLEPEGEKKEWTHWPTEVEAKARARGHVDFPTDADGVVRRTPAYLTYEGQIFPQLGLLAGFNLSGDTNALPYENNLPLDGKGNFLIPWDRHSKERFFHFRFADIIRSQQALDSGSQPLLPLDALKDKICVIGVTDPSAIELKRTPVDQAVAPPVILAQTLNSVLTSQFLMPASMMANAFVLCLLGFASSLFFTLFRNARSFMGGLGLGVAFLTLSFVLFSHFGIWVETAQPLFLILNLFIFSALYQQIQSIKEQSRLFDLATRDGLTGLYVIRHFRQILNQAVEETARKKEPLSVALLDIDNFKQINDRYGHPAGDMVLKKTAEIISACFRSKRPIHEVDFAARYGGEEFIVLMRRTKLADAAFKISERIRKSVQSAIFTWDDQRIQVTVSIGVATLRDSENIPDLMVRRADEALYRAKHAGKNQVCVESFAPPKLS